MVQLGSDTLVCIYTPSNWDAIGQTPLNDSCYDVNSFRFSRDRGNLDDDTVRKGQRVKSIEQYQQGIASANASIVMPLYVGWRASNLNGLLGSSSGAGTVADPYLYSPGDLTDTYRLVALGSNAHDTTDGWQFNLNNCMVTDWSIAVRAGEVARLSANYFGKDVSGSVNTAVPFSAALAGRVDVRAYKWSQASVTLGGSTTREIRSIRVSGNNALDTTRYTLGGYQPLQPLEVGSRSYIWDIDLRFDGLDDWAAWEHRASVDGLDTLGVKVTLTAGTNIFEINSPACILLADPTPNIGGRGTLYATLSLAVVTNTAGDEPITIKQWST